MYPGLGLTNRWVQAAIRVKRQRSSVVERGGNRSAGVPRPHPHHTSTSCCRQLPIILLPQVRRRIFWRC